MVINLFEEIERALNKIQVEYLHEFIIEDGKHPALEVYGDAKWQIIEKINDTFGSEHNLYNWLHDREDDVAHFLNEAGSNAWNYGGGPKKLKLWIGSNGFIIGIEQKSEFNIVKKLENTTKETGGLASFRKSKKKVFFDHPTSTRTVYLQHSISD